MIEDKRPNDSDSQSLSLKNLKVHQIKLLLKEKGLPVSGNKAELIERLKNGSGGINSTQRQKPKPWQYSTAKKELKRALLDPKSPIHHMSVQEIQNSNEQYKQYPKFAKYYKDLKVCVDVEIAQVKSDDTRAEEHIKNNPRNKLNRRGYAHWDTHPAKSMLAKDVTNKMHEGMTPQQLRMTHGAYKEFPPDIFAKRLYAEIAKQRAVKYWAYKRNKEGLANHLNRLTL
jgi:hypothetical protein